MSITRANGIGLHTLELGAAGAPVVMLHGLLVGNLAAWYFTGGRALAKRHRVLLYDLRGHGRSDRPTSGYGIASMTDDLEALLDGFTPEPVTLVGHSYGALISLELALRHPGRVARLVLVEPPLPPARLDELTSFLSLPAEEMVAALLDELKAAVLRGGRRSNRLLRSLQFLALETTLIDDLAANPALEDGRLEALQVPTLLVFGDTSSCLPAAERLSAALPDSRLEVLCGGHFLTVDAPAALTQAIVRFVDG